MRGCSKLTKNHTKTLVFTTSGILQQKIDDCESIYSVNTFYLIIDHASGYIEEKSAINIWLLTLQMKIKNY